MKAILVLSVAIVLLASTFTLAAPEKVTLDANDMPIREAADSIAKQSGAQVLLDGDVIGRVTASLSSVEPDRAVEMIAKSLKLEWKRTELVVAADTKVTPEKLKSAISALEALSIPGISVTDAAGKVTMLATGLAKDSATQVKLPEGQKWQVCYLISKPPSPKSDTAKKESKTTGQQEAADRAGKIMGMTPDQRQQYFQDEITMEMQLPPEARAQIWKDRISVFGNLMRDPVFGGQLREEMRAAFGSMRREGGGPGGPRPNGPPPGE